MAQYPCEVHLQRYAGPQSTIWPAKAVNAAPSKPASSPSCEPTIGTPRVADARICRFAMSAAQSTWHLIYAVPNTLLFLRYLRQFIHKRRAHLIGTILRARPVEEIAEVMRAFSQHVVPLFGAGKLRPVIDKTFKISEIQEAHRYQESNQSFGKLVLTLP